MDGPSSDHHQLNSLHLYPPARALHHVLPNTPRPTSLLRRSTRRKQRAARRIDMLERIGPRDVRWQANSGRSEQRRAEPSRARCSPASRTAPPRTHPELRAAPSQGPRSSWPVHLQMIELRIRVQLHALNHRVRQEHVPSSMARTMCASIIYDIRPTIKPVAPGSKYGTNRPEWAVTK